MKKLVRLAALLLFLPLLIGHLNAHSTQGAASTDALYRTIASLDRAVFDAYNTCDLEKFATYFAEDLEFYHDHSGLTRTRQGVVEAVKKNICGKTRRELVPGSMEVYPMANYGAVQIGSHRFCELKLTKCPESNTPAKFVHLWQEQDGAWKMTRVLSFDHK
jgi:hypothetical protein